MGNQWVNLVVLLAIVEYFAFGVLVGRARVMYGIKAPAMSGNEMFERYVRVHYNTLELLVAFVPALWIASFYWNAAWMAGVGAIYLIGRLLYLRGYVRDPKTRSIGFGLSMLPILFLVLAALAGVLRALFFS